MHNNLFSVLITTAKAKITPLVTKVKLWTSWNFIRTRVIAGIRNFFAAILDIKPRHKKDYYELLGWLISRRLVTAVLILLGVVSVFYLFTISNVYTGTDSSGGIPTYDYDSLLLRFTKGKVRIRGKSGYLAYEGEVSLGNVNGWGMLYAPDGSLVYQGNFDGNMYQGNGISYYADGTMAYNGTFEKNLYQGTGKLYRENGSLQYEGEFSQGMMEGQGKLYDTGNNVVYKGSFSQNEIVYSELLGKSTQELREYYFGSRGIYESAEEMVVVLEPINCIYVAASDEEALDDSTRIEKVIVLKNTFGSGNQKCSTMAQLNEYFEASIYQGNSRVNLGEAIAINRGIRSAQDPVQQVEMETEEKYADYTYVEKLQEDYTVYIQSYRKEGLIYTFVCDASEEGFLFYTIEAGEEE